MHPPSVGTAQQVLRDGERTYLADAGIERAHEGPRVGAMWGISMSASEHRQAEDAYLHDGTLCAPSRVVCP